MMENDDDDYDDEGKMSGRREGGTDIIHIVKNGGSTAPKRCHQSLIIITINHQRLCGGAHLFIYFFFCVFTSFL